MLHFTLFRIKVLFGPQGNLFTRPDPQEILHGALVERPSQELRKGYTWHVGNLEQVDDDGFYFALGRTTTSTLTLWHDDRGEFEEVEFDDSPYTHAYIDTRMGIVALASKSRLSPTVEGIGRQLEKLLNASHRAAETESEFDISVIKDPEEFIELLRSAYSIERFTFTFTRPNPFDVNELIIRPMTRYVREAEGTEGSSTVKGKDLNSDTLEEVTRSAAATGDNATARLRTAEGGKLITRSLRANNTIFTSSKEDAVAKKLSLLDTLRSTYRRVRNRNHDEQ